MSTWVTFSLFSLLIFAMELILEPELNKEASFRLGPLGACNSCLGIGAKLFYSLN